MAIAAKTSATEVAAQITDRFVNKACEGILIDASAVEYTPGVTDDATLIAQECPIGVGGYQRQMISFTSADVTPYVDDGVGLATKATVFSHDGGASSIDFSHVALIWAGGNVQTVTPLAVPTAAIDGVYTNIPVGFSNGSGTGLVVDLTVVDDGVLLNDYTLTVKATGKDYAAGDVCTITEEVLTSLGVVVAGAGALSFQIETVEENAENSGKLVAVAKTSGDVSLIGGNEAVFYWNLKLYQIQRTPEGA